MEMDHRCFFCFTRAFERLLEKEPVSNELKNGFTREMAALYYNSGTQLSAPVFSGKLHAILNRYTQNADPYSEVKKMSNDIVLSMYNDLKESIQTAADPFDSALRHAVAGNIIDYAVSDTFSLKSALDHVMSANWTIDHSASLQKALSNAKTVLYLGDNAGEIVFDRILIEHLNHPNLYFAVRGAPVINDVTMDDAHYVGMNWVARLISNGSSLPSTLLNECSGEFNEVFNRADVIVSKGQGNLEGLYRETGKHIFFILMVKCDVIAAFLNVKKGDFIIKDNQIS